jgi:prophage regulatory protein
MYRILRRRELESRVGLKHTAIYEQMRAGRFPRPIPLGVGGQAVGWLESEIDDWIAQRVAERDARSDGNGQAG